MIALAADSVAPTHLEMSFIELHNNAFRNLFSRKSSIQQSNDKKKMMCVAQTYEPIFLFNSLYIYSSFLYLSQDGHVYPDLVLR